MQRPGENPLLVNFILTGGIAGLFIVVGAALKSGEVRDHGILILESALLVIVSAAYVMRNQLRTVLQASVFRRSTSIYFSLAYLFLIRTKSGYYLLVRHKENAEFQPVGGVYKFHPSEELTTIFSQLGVTLKKPDAPHRINDLRGHIEGRNVNALLKWFKTGQNREVMPLREFYEELVTTNVLSAATFRYIDCRHRGTVLSPVFSMDMGGYGVFVHEVYELIVTPDQAEELEKLRTIGHPEVRFASAEEIMRLGYSPDSPKRKINISRHTRNALVMRWT